jgi:hypothetical protein
MGREVLFPVDLIVAIASGDRPWLVVGTAGFMALVILVWWGCIVVLDKWRAGPGSQAKSGEGTGSRPGEG